jgi:hypothetical protein
MVSVSRRSALWLVTVVAGGAGLNAFLERQGSPPTEAWVRERLWDEALIAYAVWDGMPRAVLRIGQRVQYDLMVPGDWIWPNWPPAPQWQLMGLGYSISSSSSPATAGLAPCVGVYRERCGRPIELFGQINDPDIVAMKVLVDGAWQTLPVAAPGYAIRVHGLTGAPAGYRWLDDADRVVWERPDGAPTKPGGSAAKRAERGRRRHGKRNTRPTSTPTDGGTLRESGADAG